MDVRKQIQRIVKDRALSQSAFARKAGIPPRQFNAILAGRRKLEAHELLRVCEALNMTVDAVVSYPDKPKAKR
jgi:predicted transcriptional regulator